MAQREDEQGRSTSEQASDEAESGDGSQKKAQPSATPHGLFGRGAERPFGLMRRMMQDVERMFGGLGMGPAWSPTIEVQQREGELLVRADLPGLKQSDIEVQVLDGALMIQGERRQERHEEQRGSQYTERRYGKFSRSIAIPSGIRVEDAEAQFRDGVLEVRVALPEPPRTRTVPIRAANEDATALEGRAGASGSSSPSASAESLSQSSPANGQP